jgi:hypothetical protein
VEDIFMYKELYTAATIALHLLTSWAAGTGKKGTRAGSTKQTSTPIGADADRASRQVGHAGELHAADG